MGGNRGSQQAPFGLWRELLRSWMGWGHREALSDVVAWNTTSQSSLTPKPRQVVLFEGWSSHYGLLHSLHISFCVCVYVCFRVWRGQWDKGACFEYEHMQLGKHTFCIEDVIFFAFIDIKVSISLSIFLTSPFLLLCGAQWVWQLVICAPKWIIPSVKLVICAFKLFNLCSWNNNLCPQTNRTNH